MPDFRQKTIRVPVNFTPVTDLINNTLTLIGTPTIYIPENDNSTVTFKSVMLQFGWADISTSTGASGISISSFQTEIELQDGLSSNITINATTNIANSGENMSMIFGPVDYTDYFNADIWTSDQTSQTCATSILINTSTGTITDFREVYAWYDITYEYPVDANTYIQTVCIPHESYSTFIPTTATEITTLSQLKGVGGILTGYNTPVVRHRWLEIKGCDGQTVTTDFNLRYSFDMGTLLNLETIESALATSRYHVYQINTIGLDDSTTHTLELASTLATRFGGIIINEWVSFEYTVSETTRVLNYIEVPVEIESFVGNSSITNSSFGRELLIPEKNITQLNCAVELNFTSNAGGYQHYIKCGSQTFKNYVSSAAVLASPVTLQHRFDSNSSAGEGIALTSGLNTLSVFYYEANNKNMSNLTGVIKILYLSDVSSTGLHNHTQTLRKIHRTYSMENIGAGGATFVGYASTLLTSSFAIPNTDYYIQTSGLNYNLAIAILTTGLTFKSRLLSGEGIGDGYRVLYTDQYYGDQEMSYAPMYVSARDEFKRYPGDPDNNRMDITTNRTFSLVGSYRASGGAWNVTYHGITHIISGSVTGSSDLTSSLQLFQVVDGEYNLYKTGSAEGDTDFQFTVYDDTTPYIVSAYANSSLKGISKSSTPTTGFDIDYAAGGGGGAGGEFFF
jgi:hypothetical protein